MRRVLITSALVFVGCIHAKQAELPEGPPAGQEVKQPQEKPAREATPKPKQKQSPESSKQSEPDDGRPRLSSKAEGLLLPAGPKLIQQALAQKGYLPREHQTGDLDAMTSLALRRFQEDEHAPRTGYPDRETVRKLGLSVEKVFKVDRGP